MHDGAIAVDEVDVLNGHSAVLEQPYRLLHHHRYLANCVLVGRGQENSTSSAVCCWEVRPKRAEKARMPPLAFILYVVC